LVDGGRVDRGRVLSEDRGGVMGASVGREAPLVIDAEVHGGFVVEGEPRMQCGGLGIMRGKITSLSLI